MYGSAKWIADARQGQIRRHKQLTFLACEGLIVIHDERDASKRKGSVYDVICPTVFAEHARGMQQLASRMVKSRLGWQRQEGRELQQAARDMLDTIKEARDMGDPSDPKVQAFWAKHRSKAPRVGGFSFEQGAPKQSLQEIAAAAPVTAYSHMPPPQADPVMPISTPAANLPLIFPAPRKKSRQACK